MSRLGPLGLVVAALLLSWAVPTPSFPEDDAAPLAPRHAKWLEEVDLIITPVERQEFLALGQDYRRDAFIEAFWEARNPEPGSRPNEYREAYYRRREEAQERWGSTTRDMPRMFILHGPPSEIHEVDCGTLLWPVQVWHYRNRRGHTDFLLLFVQRAGGGPFQLWWPSEGWQELAAYPIDNQDFLNVINDRCPVGDVGIMAAFMYLMEHETSDSRRVQIPPRADPEWLQSFAATSTDPDPDAELLTGDLEVTFPGRQQSRVLVRGVIDVTAGPAEAVGERHGFAITGEVLRDGELFDTFRYRYDLEAPADRGVTLPLVFERFLRPGDYHLIVKVEHLATGRELRLEQDLTVPPLEAASGPEGEEETGVETAPVRQARVSIVPPRDELVRGRLRVEAEVEGEGVDHVAFLLDGHPVFSKRRPPFSVELALGSVPRSHLVTAVAYDADDRPMGSDELLLNPAPHRFRLALEQPERVADHQVELRFDLQLPEGKRLDRVELFIDEGREATLYQPPWRLLLPLPQDHAATFARAVAYLTDGQSVEDAVSLSGEDFGEKIDVDLVELYTTVIDPAGDAVPELGPEDFTVVENGVEQKLLRVQEVEELPLHVALLVDTSASMEETLPAVEEAALRFFDEALRPGDEAALVTFSDRPRLASRFTGDLDRLAGAFATLRAERTTAVWDSVVFALHYFQGLRGRQALLLLSDGDDYGSRYSFDDTVRFAQHAGVVIYTLTFGKSKLAHRLEGGHRLRKLAEETGGRSFLLETVEGLDEVYATIERDLRSQYLLAYQSSNGGDDPEALRTVQVTVHRPGLETRTQRGYLP